MHEVASTNLRKPRRDMENSFCIMWESEILFRSPR